MLGALITNPDGNPSPDNNSSSNPNHKSVIAINVTLTQTLTPVITHPDNKVSFNPNPKSDSDPNPSNNLSSNSNPSRIVDLHHGMNVGKLNTQSTAAFKSLNHTSSLNEEFRTLNFICRYPICD